MAIDSFNPRSTAEAAATLYLAYEQSSVVGGARIPFSDMQLVNPRFVRCPEAGIATIQHMDIVAVNHILMDMGDMAVAEIFDNGDVALVWRSLPRSG